MIINILLNSILIYFFTKFCYKIKFVDRPMGRKSHSSPTAYSGGMYFFSALLISIYLYEFEDKINYILISSFIIFFTGLVDDRIDLNSYLRIIIQFCSSYLLVSGGISIEELSIVNLYDVHLGSFAPLFTVLCVTLFVNASNFIDGIDGLAISVFMISIIFVFINIFNNNSNLTPQQWSIFLSLLLIAIPFLIFNISKLNKSFLGNSGSYLIGFILASIIIYYHTPFNRNIFTYQVIWCLAYQVYDFMHVSIKRISQLKSPFNADREHFHHLLLDLKITPLKVLIIIVGLNLFLNLLGILISSFEVIYLHYLLFIFFFFFFAFIKAKLKSK